MWAHPESPISNCKAQALHRALVLERRPPPARFGGCKNKVQKSGMFLVAQKHAANHHVFTTNPPQHHHNLPPQNTPKSAKPPVKPPRYLSQLFSAFKSQISRNL
jgi:hypothetical protein